MAFLLTNQTCLSLVWIAPSNGPWDFRVWGVTDKRTLDVRQEKCCSWKQLSNKDDQDITFLDLVKHVWLQVCGPYRFY